MLLRHVCLQQRTLVLASCRRRAVGSGTTSFNTWRRTIGILSHQHQDRSHLNVINFFDPALAPAPPYYTLNHGASGFAKSDKAPTSTPEEDALYTSVQVGDDAYFLRRDALGVADGVGGWRKHAGKYINHCWDDDGW